MPDTPKSSPILRLDPTLSKKELAKIRDNFSAVVLHGSSHSLKRKKAEADKTVPENINAWRMSPRMAIASRSPECLSTQAASPWKNRAT
jgi:hypothetical protein